MIYDAKGYRQQVLEDPLPCYHWQQSELNIKNSLTYIYPTFALKPSDFLNASHNADEYIKPLLDNTLSYRKVDCHWQGSKEVPCHIIMTTRDRIEFAYRTMRFQMHDFLNLINRENREYATLDLPKRYFEKFDQYRNVFIPFFNELYYKKHSKDFSVEPENMVGKLRAFFEAFIDQFNDAFDINATRHLIFRHGPAIQNKLTDDQQRFQGRNNTDILDIADASITQLIALIKRNKPTMTYTSPLLRAKSSLDTLRNHTEFPDYYCNDALIEMNYGALEGHTIGWTHDHHSELFQQRQNGEDPSFPNGGESIQDVYSRIKHFIQSHYNQAQHNTLCCSHTVVIRCLIGHLMGIDFNQWHKIKVPYLKGIEVISCEAFGLFIDFDKKVEKQLFNAFFLPQHATTAEMENWATSNPSNTLQDNAVEH